MSAKGDWPWEDKFGDYLLVPVPAHEKRSFLIIFCVFTGVLARIAVLWGGGTLGSQFTFFKEAMVVAVVSSAILAVIGGGGLTTTVGGISNCSTYVNMRYPFGRTDRFLAKILSGVSYVYNLYNILTK